MPGHTIQTAQLTHDDANDYNSREYDRVPVFDGLVGGLFGDADGGTAKRILFELMAGFCAQRTSLLKLWVGGHYEFNRVEKAGQKRPGYWAASRYSPADAPTQSMFLL